MLGEFRVMLPDGRMAYANGEMNEGEVTAVVIAIKELFQIEAQIQYRGPNPSDEWKIW